MKNNPTIKNYWDRNSPAFTNQYRTIFGMPVSMVGIFLRLRQNKITKLLAGLSGKNVADIGCGSGVFMVEAVKQQRYVYGIDYSDQMLDIARLKLKAYSSHRFKLIRADAVCLPLKTNDIDIVIASGLTDYLTTLNLAKFLDEVARILRIKGFIIITFPKKDSLLAFLRIGVGLKLRKIFLKLPPMENSYRKLDIEKVLKERGLHIQKLDEVFGTMWIVLAQKL